MGILTLNRNRSSLTRRKRRRLLTERLEARQLLTTTFEAYIDFGVAAGSPVASGYDPIPVSNNGWSALASASNVDRGAIANDLERDLIQLKRGTFTLYSVPEG